MLAEDDAYFIDKDLQRNVSLRPADDKVLATFAPADQDAVRKLSGWSFDDDAFQATAPRGYAVGVLAAASLEQVPAGPPPPVKAWVQVYEDVADGRLHYVRPDELEVMFRDGVPTEVAEGLLTAQGASPIDTPIIKGYYRAATQPRRSFATIRALTELPEVLFAAPVEMAADERIRSAPAAPPSNGTTATPAGRKEAPLNDPDPRIAAALREPLFGELWALRNVSQLIPSDNDLVPGPPRGQKGVDVDAIRAWRVSMGDPRVVVAVVDQRIDVHHPDLAPRVLPGEFPDFIDPADIQGGSATAHATGVAGVALAAVNGKGGVGLAPECSLLPLAVSLTGICKYRADAIYYVAQRAAADPTHRFVLNLSWEVPVDTIGVRLAVRQAIEAGVVVVAGVREDHDGGPPIDLDATLPYYPCSYPGVLAVTSTDQADVVAPGAGIGSRVDVAAPGVAIKTASVPGWELENGTSFAAPFVSALAALLLSVDRTLSVDAVRHLIKSACKNIDQVNPTLLGKFGSGRISAGQALTQLASLRGTEAVRPPVLAPPILTPADSHTGNGLPSSP
jgi:hypothetical protein